MNFVEVIEQELVTFDTLLTTIPFSESAHPRKFLKIYRLNYAELYSHSQTTPLPLDPEKLVKLSISFGNLLRSLALDEESYQAQQASNNTFNAKLNMARNGSDAASHESPKHYINSSGATQPLYHTKFIRNLLVILKSFDIGKHEMSASQSTSTINQYTSSPIKLNSKQLLIEKLEINIRLDTLFVFKILLQLLIRLFGVIRDQLGQAHEFAPSTPVPSVENSSIFSINSGQSSDSFISIDDYLKIVHQILHRVSTGLVEPLLRYLMDFVTTSVTSEFATLIESL